MEFQTARRIKELAKEVPIDFKKIYLVGNKFTLETESMLEGEANRMGVEYAGNIPHDDNVLKYNLTGQPLVELPLESPALQAAKGILTRIGLLDKKRAIYAGGFI